MNNYDDEAPTKTLMQTYVFFSSETQEDKAFFVSTIDRNSSSMYEGRYAETFVWEWNSTERKRGGIVNTDEALEGSIRKHILVCEELYKHGRILQDGDE